MWNGQRQQVHPPRTARALTQARSSHPSVGLEGWETRGPTAHAPRAARAPLAQPTGCLVTAALGSGLNLCSSSSFAFRAEPVGEGRDRRFTGHTGPVAPTQLFPDAQEPSCLPAEVGPVRRSLQPRPLRSCPGRPLPAPGCRVPSHHSLEVPRLPVGASSCSLCPLKHGTRVLAE